MEQKQYLIDTNAVIDYLGLNLPAKGMAFMNEVVNAIPNVSVITKIEVLGFNTPLRNYTILNDFMNDSNVFELTSQIVDLSIAIRQTNKTKLPDAIIAATAMVYDLILVTRNISDFKNIKGLSILNPHEIFE